METIGRRLVESFGRRLTLEVLQSSTTYQAKPYIHTEWLAHGYFVDICAPIEVRSIDDLVKLVDLVKRLLKREKMLDNEFPKYAYTKAQYHAEGLNTKTNKL